MSRVDAYLQIAEAAEMLGVCQNTLRNWGRAGKVTEYRHPVNNYRLYKQEELEKMVRQLESPEPVVTNSTTHPPKTKGGQATRRATKRRKPR